MIETVHRHPLYIGERHGKRMIHQLTPTVCQVDGEFLYSPQNHIYDTLIDHNAGLLSKYATLESEDWILSSLQRCQLREELYFYVKTGKDPKIIVKNILGLYKLYRDKENIVYFRNEVFCELLSLAAHVCEYFKIDDEALMQYIILEYIFYSKSPIDWFQFLSPLAFATASDSLYPHHMSLSLDGPSQDIEDSDISSLRPEPYKIKALDFYLKFLIKIPIAVHCGIISYSDLEENELSPNPVSHITYPYLDLRSTKNIGGGSTIDVLIDFINMPTYMCGFGIVTPLTWACQQGSSKSVQLLLRYGAKALHPFGSFKTPYKCWDQPLYNLCNNINLRLGYFCSQRGVHYKEYKEDDSLRESLREMYWVADKEQTMELFACLEWLFAAFPYLPVQFGCAFCKHQNKSKGQFLSYMCLDTKVLDYINPDISKDVPKLKIICRYEIRKCIHPKKVIEVQLSTLPLPKVLIDFLDLKFLI